MFTYKFYIHEGRDNMMMLRVVNNRKKSETTLGIKITPKELELALAGKSKDVQLVKLMAEWTGKISDYIYELAQSKQGDMPPSEIMTELRKRLLGDKGDYVEKKPQPTLGNFLPFYTEHAQAYTRRSTRESNEYTLSVLRKFATCKGFALDGLNFEDISYAWLSDLDKFMEGCGLSQNTRRIHFANIRAAINEAYKRELTDVDPFRRFKLKKEKTPKRSLTVEELRKLFDYQPEPHAVYYRDMFKLIFMLIGINTVDLYSLKEINNFGRVEYRRAKTGRLYSIRVEPEAMEIIERYRGVSALLNIADKYKDHRYFRRDTNDALRLIGNVTRSGRGGKKSYEPLWPEITTYWARHTWATIARSLKIPKDDIALALGHGGRTVTDIYIDEDLTAIDEANRKVLDWVLYGKKTEWAN